MTTRDDVQGLAEQVIYRGIDENEGYLLHLGTHTLFSLNGTGLCLLRALERGSTEEQLADVLARAYDLDAQQSRADVRTFLAELHCAGLLRVL